MGKCGIIFPYSDYHDEEGCLKQECHIDDSHVFKNEKGELIAWQDDTECNCGCWNDYERKGDVCVVYRVVLSINEKF